MERSRFTAYIEFRVRESWFELDLRTRHDYAVQLDEMVGRHSAVTFRWFDAEAWMGRLTDFVLCEFEDLDAYNSLWGELRRHPFLSTPYAVISRVDMGMELDLVELAASCPERRVDEEVVVASEEVGGAEREQAAGIAPVVYVVPVEAVPIDAGVVEPGPVEPGPVEAKSVEVGTVEVGTVEVGTVEAAVQTLESSPSPKPSKVECPNCGNLLKKKARFCGKCGKEV